MDVHSDQAFERAVTTSTEATPGELTGEHDLGGGVLDARIAFIAFHDCVIRNGSLSCSTVVNCTFTNVRFIDVVLDFVEFQRCALRGMVIEGGSSEGMRFTDCVGRPQVLNN